jgi:tetratricopeptide (TPR) repeat protein
MMQQTTGVVMRPARVLHAVIYAAIVFTAATAGPADKAAHARVLMQRGVAHEQAGQNRQAVTELSQALATKALSRADTVRAYFDRGVAYDSLRMGREAISDYSSAIRLDPAFSPALNNRANAYRRLGQVEQAKRDYFAALKCPGVLREYPFYGLGQLAEKKGDRGTARDYYLKALAANPAFALAAQALGGLTAPARTAPMASVHAPGRTIGPVALRQAIVDAKPHVAASALIQLGAYRDEAAAQAGWNKISAAGGFLNGLTPFTVIADIPGKGRFWRLRSAVPDGSTAQRLCRELKANGNDCLVVRN